MSTISIAVFDKHFCATVRLFDHIYPQLLSSWTLPMDQTKVASYSQSCFLSLFSKIILLYYCWMANIAHFSRKFYQSRDQMSALLEYSLQEIFQKVHPEANCFASACPPQPFVARAKEYPSVGAWCLDLSTLRKEWSANYTAKYLQRTSPILTKITRDTAVVDILRCYNGIETRDLFELAVSIIYKTWETCSFDYKKFVCFIILIISHHDTAHHVLLQCVYMRVCVCVCMCITLVKYIAGAISHACLRLKCDSNIHP